MQYKEIKGSHTLTGGPMSNNELWVSDEKFPMTEELKKRLDEIKDEGE